MFINFVFLNSSSAIQNALINEFLKYFFNISYEEIVKINESNQNYGNDENKKEKDGNILVKKEESFISEKFNEKFKSVLEVLLEK